MTRQARIDLFAAPLVLVDRLDAPTPQRSSAVRTKDGYLLADAYIARDGLLRYSDGTSSWMEYRPRDELVAAAATWQHAPVTDDHPRRMVDAQNWAEVARGVHVSAPVVEGPLKDGVSYLRAQLLITDAALISKLESGEARELSIGFTATILPAPGRTAPDGTRCDAVQTGLDGNHTAVVVRGRAGPACAIVLDGAAIAIHDPSVSVSAGQSDSNMPQPKTPKTAPAKKHPTFVKGKTDEAGMPTTMSKLVMPDGSEIEVPTALAAIVEEWTAMKSAEGKAPESAPPAPAPEAPAAESAGGPPPAPASPKPEEEEEPAMKPDAVNALVAKVKTDAEELVKTAEKKSALVRRCVRDGIDDDKIDACTDYVALARLYVASKTPHVKALADKATGAVLDALVDAASLAPVAIDPNANPFEVSDPIKMKADAADEVNAHAEWLMSQGVTG